MKKLTLLFSVFLLYTSLFGQNKHKFSLEMALQYNYTIYDRVVANNGEGIGIGVALLMATKSDFNPMLEFTADIFSGNKVLYSTSDSLVLEGKDGVPAFWIGGMYQPLKRAYLAFTLGPAFINSNVYLGIKPTIGYHIGKKNRFNAKLTLVNIFQRDEASNEPFGYLSLGLGVKLF